MKNSKSFMTAVSVAMAVAIVVAIAGGVLVLLTLRNSSLYQNTQATVVAVGSRSNLLPDSAGNPDDNISVVQYSVDSKTHLAQYPISSGTKEGQTLTVSYLPEHPDKPVTANMFERLKLPVMVTLLGLLLFALLHALRKRSKR